MGDKRRVFLTLFGRDELSVGENRMRLGSEAYHWALLIAPKSFQKSTAAACHSFDVTNGAKVDPENRVNLNPNGDWYHRHKPNTDPARSGRLLCMTMIGKVPNDVGIAQIVTALSQLQLPSRHVQGQHCVWWIKRAVRRLQLMGLAEQFDVDRLEADGLRLADQAFEELRRGVRRPRPKIENYTTRPL
jgi:hypothetical protein